MNQRITKRGAGFTVVEVVVAAFVLTLVMAGSYRLIIESLRMNRLGLDHYVASNLCKNRLERARNFRYEDLHLLGENDMMVDEHGAWNPGGRYRRSTMTVTNETGLLTTLIVTVEIKSPRSGLFEGERQQMASMYTFFNESTPK